MRIQIAYTFTNEEKRTLQDLLWAEMNKIKDTFGYDENEWGDEVKKRYTELYNLYIQF